MRDKAEDNFQKGKGNLKEIAGGLSDNPTSGTDGAKEKIADNVQAKIGHLKKVLGK